MIKKFLSALAFLFPIIIYCQDFSNKGKDFWVGYGYHIRMNQAGANGNTQEMVLYFTSDVNASVTVEIPSIGYMRTYQVIANQVTETEALPKTGSQDSRLNAEGLSNKGIHILSDKAIVAYAHIYNTSISGASLLFPTTTLGKEYYSINFTQSSNEANSNSWFYVIGTEDATLVEITPTAATTGGKPANTPFTVTLNKGQVYNVLATTTGNTGGDLTGSKIRSISSGTGGCKKIAVFSGSGKINIGCNTGSADNLIQQVTPINAWGKKFLTTPTQSQPNNYFRVLVLDPTTVVTRNGAVMTGLTNNFYYQFTGNSPNVISADKPILVAQYSTTQGCAGNGNPGDPEMIYLSPIEQTISKITLNSTAHYQITAHYINVIIKNGGVSSFRLDGAAVPSFVTHPQDPTYSYASIQVSAGAHSLSSDSGFNAIAYGYGQAESYGYNAGTNVLDLFQYVTLQNQYATVNFPATCKNAPFFFSITLPYQATSLNWDFNNNPNLTPNATVVNNNPVPDSTFIREGRTLYVYKLPNNYVFTNPGTYPVKVTANNPTPDGCSGIQEINYDVEVYDPPKANWSFTHTGCLRDSVKFFDNSIGNGRPTIKWNWSFGDNTTDTLRNPSKLYAAAGTYNVKLQVITDVGCIADTTKSITLSPQPLAKFGVSGAQCINSSLTFVDSSSIPTGGSITKWYWNFGNGNAQIATTNSPQIQAYPAAGTYTVTLEVENNTGCKSLAFTRQINIYPNPVVDFTLPIVCLPAGIARFTDISTISDGTASTFKYQWSFGDGGTDTVKNPTHIYNSIGPFPVKLTVTSVNGCIKDTTKSISTIYAQAIAGFTVSPEVCLRDTTFFTDNTNGQGSALVKWRWEFGDNTTDTVQNPRHKYVVAGTYTVKYFTITDKGCSSDTITKTTIVNPLPTPLFNVSTPLCETQQVTITDQSIPNAGLLNSWNWDFGDGNTGAFNNSNPFTHTYTNAGTYNIKLVVASNKGCISDTLLKPVIINAIPVADFILPEVCLSDAFAEFLDSSYIADGSAGSFTYQWNFGDPNATPLNPNTSTVKNPRHKYSNTGVYNVQLIITSSKGCKDTLVKAFTVNGSIPNAGYSVLNTNNLCSNTQVQIQNSSTVDFGTITKVEIIWDNLNAPTIVTTDQLPTAGKIYGHTYPNLQTTSTYQVRFRAFSGTSCVDEEIKTITVNASPKVVFGTIPGICLDGAPRQITQANGGSVLGTGVFSGTGVNATGLYNPAAAGAGTYLLHYVYTTAKGCSDSADKNITVWPSPNAVWGYNLPTCVNNGVTFHDTSVANFSNIIQWKWTFGDGTTDSRSTNSAFSKTYITSNTYTASLQVITDSGCVSNVITKQIIIHPLPVVNFTLPSVCLPDGRALFTNTSTIVDGTESGFSYRWNFGETADPTPSTVKDPTHKYSSIGPFNVQLIVTSIDGCKDSITKALTTVHPQPDADFSFSPPDSCLGGTFYFTDLSNGITSNVATWNWNFNDGTTASVQNPSRKFVTAKTFNVSLIITNQQGCTSDTAMKSVVVYPYPTVNAGADQFILEGGNYVMNPTVNGNALSYRWSPASYLSNDTLLKPLTTPTDDITYRLTVTGQGNCKSWDEVLIKVLKAPTIPTAFSPNGDGINDVWNIKYLESYPGCTVEIFNRYGQAVFYSKGYGKPWDGTYNGNPLPVGVYYYIVDPKNGRKKYAGSITIIK